MTEMVEQVVRQVRVRMMPESTNMEIQLHPASLGRVNVQINATGQETTARLIVENQAAKEALEAGMIRLQEAFEERGVKVQAVEVTVGSFEMGLEQSNAGEADGDGDSNGRSSQGGSSEGGSAEAETTEGNMTAASRRDINSTVDYTA
jgi:flagellar hook-length control protein FliK